ncbi:protein C1orf43 homolog [Cylas formicarius]|uniref:protein C1orf43 homolog n=1 Tax=Cylas formicarius TaxID=197179 RepID=UPI002958ABBA|nr:protein C1orf43 homolog [Cylas formicarius]
MSEELNGVAVVIIIGLGALTVILLFIFAKRQIMRFTLRSRRGPHVPIGHDGPKLLKREIEKRLDIIPRILCEPKLIAKADPRYILFPGQQIPIHYYRMKAVDDVKVLEGEITKQDSCLVRHPSENLRAYLLTTLAAPLDGTGQRLIHQFCDLYEHARHDPSHFGDEEYQQYNRLLLKLVDAAKLLKSYNSRKSSPNRTPQKRQLQDKEKNLNLSYNVDEVLTVPDSRPTTISVPLSSDTETSV